MANAVAECSWLRQLLQELLLDVPKATIVYCDNVSVVYLSTNPFIIVARSILSSTFTSCESRWLLGASMSFKFPPLSSLPMS